MRRAIFPGSFDPITTGHVDVLSRAETLFDEIIIAIGINTTKGYMFPLEKRKLWIENIFRDNEKIKVQSYENLTIDFCKKNEAQFILRGIRNPSDFEFEKTIAHFNKNLEPNIETVFLLTSNELSYISSSTVREVISIGGDYTKFVPKEVRM